MNIYITSVTHLSTSRDQCTVLVPSCCTIYLSVLHYWKQFVCNVNYCIHLTVIPSERCQYDSLCLHLRKISTSVLSQISDDFELIDWAVMLRYQLCCRYHIDCVTCIKLQTLSVLSQRAHVFAPNLPWTSGNNLYFGCFKGLHRHKKEICPTLLLKCCFYCFL